MKIVKPMRLALLTHVYERTGRYYFAVNVACFFSLARPQRLLSEVSMWKFVAEALGKDAVIDMGMPKPCGEFLVQGKCYAREGKPVAAANVRVKVGHHEKLLQVWGDRHWKKVGPLSCISDPLPFVEMDVSYRHAFGGAGYAANPLGKGMPPLQEGLPQPLPNIENPREPIFSRDDRPLPAGLGPLDLTWPQRFAKRGTHDAHWLKTRFPGYPDDLDASMFNAAPPDQWVADFFKGDEAFEVSGMHPDKPVLQGVLPGYAARCFVTQRQGGVPGGEAQEPVDVFREVPMHAETLLLFPGAERGILMFRGVLEITTDDASDVVHLLAGAESLAEPKSLAHYQDVLAIRLDKRRGAMHALMDAPLLPVMPESDGTGDARSSDDTDGMQEMAALLQSKNLKRLNLRRKVEKELENAKEKLRTMRAELLGAGGQDQSTALALAEIDKALAMTVPPDPATPSLEELPAFVAEAEQTAKEARSKAKADAVLVRADAEAKIRALCQDNKLDFDAFMAKSKQQGGGPPQPQAQKILQQLRDVKAQLTAYQVPVPELLESQLADPSLVKKLADADVQMMQAYRKQAHMYPPVQKLVGVPAETMRAKLLAAMAQGEGVSGSDFTGADFSGMDLAGVDFSEALLDGADFSSSDLRGADFSNAVLARADMGKARLAGANFSKANLGFARLAGVQAMAANFSDAVLAGADLAGADLSGARLVGCDLMGSQLAGTNFSRVSAPKAKFMHVDLAPKELDLATLDEPIDLEAGLPELDLRGACFAGADLSEALFLHCRLDGADFSGACLDKALFLTVLGDGVNFSGAKLQNLRVVKESRLQQADFRGARLQNANLRGCDLRQGNFAGADLRQADLSEAGLGRAVFCGANASGLRLSNADLGNADFSGANLAQSVMRKADIRGALFSRANLFESDMLRVIRDKDTVFERANLRRTLLSSSETQS